MIILYDYQGKSNEERQQPIHTSVTELTDKVVVKILMVKLALSQPEAEEMVEKGSREGEAWWSEERRYSVEKSED